jgi:hypothetical protein
VLIVGACSFPGSGPSGSIDGAPGGEPDAARGEIADADPDAPDAAVDGAAPPAPDAAFACPNGYALRAPGSCHRTGPIPLGWAAAETDCETDGAHLVVVDDAAENAALPDFVWIGFTENVVGGVFRWVTGVPAVFTGWATGEPVPGGSTCTEARPDGWHDDGCTEPKLYVCEYDGLPADPTTF